MNPKFFNLNLKRFMKRTLLKTGGLLLGLAGMTAPLRAELPEPDNVIYGMITRNGLPVHATDTDVVIEARRNSDGAIVASYRMGDSARSGDNFTLRVPLEVFTPIFDPLSSLSNTPMTIVASDFNGDFAQVPFILGSRGQFHQLNIIHGGGFDSDSDGLIDEWEMAWFGNLLPNSTGDSDGDGATNGYEYFAGTNPTDPNSRFRLSIQRISSTTNEVSFVAQAASGNGYQNKARTYTLEWRASLSTGSWTTVAGYVGVLGTGQTVRYAVPPQGPATGFYRVVIQLNNTTQP